MKLMIFLIYLFCEIYFFNLFINKFGFFSLIIEVILSALFGLMLILGNNLKFISINNFNFKNVVGSVLFRLIGAILLIIPGIITDILGIIFFLISFFLRKTTMNNTFNNNDTDISNDDTIIDVEIEDDRKL